MATVIFDFDSTLIRCESLDHLLSSLLSGQPDKMAAVIEITEKGMNGEIPFYESLQRRLAICAPTEQQVTQFSESMVEYLTPGMDELMKTLQGRHVDVWIMSGGLKPLILPVARYLNIPFSQVHAAELNWHKNGEFAGIDTSNPFSVSKLSGARSIASHWSKPAMIIGDGFTDYQVYQDKLTDDFIIYTEHAARPKVLATGAPQAENVDSLRQQILRLVA